MDKTGSGVIWRGGEVWDFAPAYQDRGEAPVVGPVDVAAIAASGARTLYLQTAGVTRTVGPTEEPGLLGRSLAAAHALSRRLPAEVGPCYPLALIVPPTAVLEEAGSPFPWRSLHRLYDAWIPRIAWTPGGADGADPANLTRRSSTTAGTLIEVGRASAGGFGDRELSE